MGWFSTQLPKCVHYCFNIFNFFLASFISSCYINAFKAYIVLLPLIYRCIYKKKNPFCRETSKNPNQQINKINKQTYKQVINSQAFEPQTYIHAFIHSFICFIYMCDSFLS